MAGPTQQQLLRLQAQRLLAHKPQSTRSQEQKHNRRTISFFKSAMRMISQSIAQQQYFHGCRQPTDAKA
jgi:hypothetical protein